MQLSGRNQFPTRNTKFANSSVHAEFLLSESSCFQIWELRPISKTFDGKIAWYHEVFQIITLHPRDKNLLYLQGYLESTVSKCLLLWFDFGDFSGKNNCKEIIDCESLSRGLASGQSSVMIIGLLVNTEVRYGASIYGLYIYS